MVDHSYTAGGAAAAGGFEFQARAAAWFAAHILAERTAAHLFGLEPADALVSIRCEADAPVDDIIVKTSAGGFLFVQVKAGLRWSASLNSPLGRAIDQFVRQYLTSEGRRPWERPLEVGRDRLLLVVRADSSRTVIIDFPSLLERVRSLPSDDALEQAVRTQSQSGLLSELVGLVEASWLSHMAERPPSGAVRDILALIRVVVLDLGPEGRDAASATSMLADVVLRDWEQAATAWSTLVATCLGYSAERSGGGRPELQQALTQRGIWLRAAPSYRGDIEQLIRYSARLTDALRGLSEIRVGRVLLKIQRPVVTALRAAAEQGHCLVVGEAGAGKSGAVHDLVGVLREEGRDVVFLAVDRLAAEDEAGLRAALGLEHHLDEILANWPGTEPGFIVIDALDAARSDRSAKVVRELIRRIISAENRWLVVASICKFDLRYSHETAKLFAGVPSNSFQDGEFSGVRHVDVRRLSDDELHQVGSQSSAVAEIVEAAPPRLQGLLRNPFNLRLIAELVGVGVVTAELMPIRTLDQLLSRYWGERVVREDRTGTERERVLSKITIGMIASRRLRVPRLSLPANLPGSALDDLLSHHVLAEWQPTPDSLPDRYVLTFAHHVLFDYAAARLVFQASGGPDAVARRLSDEPDLILMLRPSLEMYCHHLWESDLKRHTFWQAALKFQQAPNLRELARLVAPSVAADSLSEMADLDGLLSLLRTEDAERRDAGAALISHLVGAALAWPPNKQEERLSVGPWCKLALRVSERIDPPSLAYRLRSLLFQLVKLAPPTEEYLADLNLVARHLLEHAWQRSPRDGHLAAQAIQLVCQTIPGGPGELATILRRALEPAHLQQYGYQEMFWLAEQIPALARAAPALARDVYRVAFSFVEERDEQVPFSPSQILPLTQSIRQAYSSSWYSLEQAFPEFLQTSPEEATRACLQALEGHVHREHSRAPEQPRSAEFRVGARTARIVEDWSYIWAAGADRHEEALKLLTHLIDHLTELDRDVDRQAELSAILNVIVEESKFAVVWAALLRAGGRAPRRLGPWLAPLLTAPPILTFLDTLTAAGDYLAAIFGSLPAEVRAQIEHAILQITDDGTPSDDERAELIRNRLLGCLNDADLVTPNARLLLANLRAADAVPENEPPFRFTTEWAEYTPERHLREQGVPTEEPANWRLLELEPALREFEREYTNREPTLDAIRAVAPHIAGLWEAVSQAPKSGAHEAQVTHSLAVLAAACAAAAKSPDLAQGDRVGALICEVLLFASTHTDPGFDATGAERFNEFAGLEQSSGPHRGCGRLACARPRVDFR